MYFFSHFLRLLRLVKSERTHYKTRLLDIGYETIFLTETFKGGILKNQFAGNSASWLFAQGTRIFPILIKRKFAKIPIRAITKSVE